MDATQHDNEFRKERLFALNSLFSKFAVVSWRMMCWSRVCPSLLLQSPRHRRSSSSGRRRLDLGCGQMCRAVTRCFCEVYRCASPARRVRDLHRRCPRHHKACADLICAHGSRVRCKRYWTVRLAEGHALMHRSALIMPFVSTSVLSLHPDIH